MPFMTMAHSDLPKLAQELAGQGRRLMLPVREGPEVFFREGADASRLDLGAMPKNSIKEAFFPKCDRILNYRYEGKDVAVEDVDPPAAPAVVFGARPCDAASLPIVEPLWNWDYRDKFFNERRRRTVVVTYACRQAPAEACFCVSVGLSPSAEQGSDVLLYPLDESTVAVNLVTEAGKALEGAFARFRKGQADEMDITVFQETGRKSLAHRKPLDKVKGWLDTHFEHPLWEQKTFQCLGCGTCTFLCPTCHCFDIQDESVFDGGSRWKNWDGCQFGLFTLHTSGHNPRSAQPQRYRQRILHKYSIYPDKFGKILCTGCGRCVSHCPVNLSLYDVVASAQELAEKGE